MVNIDISTLLFSYEAVISMVLWVFSVGIGIFKYFYISHKVNKTNNHKFRELLSHISMWVFAFSTAQYVILWSTLHHQGIVHGWNIHLVKEYLALGFFMFAVCNYYIWIIIESFRILMESGEDGNN